MTKYNLHQIMTRAWELVKKAAMTISAALKEAWKEAKNVAKKIKFERTAKVPVVINGEINPCVGTEYDCESNYYRFSLWEKYGKKRIYINDYKNRKLGYIEDGIICSAYNKYVRETAIAFLEAYDMEYTGR